MDAVRESLRFIGTSAMFAGTTIAFYIYVRAFMDPTKMTIVAINLCGEGLIEMILLTIIMAIAVVMFVKNMVIIWRMGREVGDT